MKAEITDFLKTALSKSYLGVKKFLDEQRPSLPFLLFVVIFLCAAGVLEMYLYYLASTLGYRWVKPVFLVCGGIIVIVLALRFLIEIPEYHFGVVIRFGNRTGRILYEGLNYLLPFEIVKLVSQELVTVPVEAGFTTKDRLHLETKGSLQYRADPHMKDNEGRNIFITMSEEAINKGIIDGIKAKLGSLGGTYEGKDFIENRLTISQIINTALRLGQEPHEIHKCGSKNEEECNVENCKFTGPISIDRLISFYKEHWPMVKKILGEEDKKPADRSNVEKRHGIDIVKFALADISFSEETKKAFEKEQQTEAITGAYINKIAMAKLAIDELKASPQEALNSVDVTLDPKVRKNVVSVEGEAGVLGGLFGEFTKARERS